MLKLAFEPVGDDFHVTVRVHWEAAAPGHTIVVHDAQSAKVHVLGVVVIGKGKREVRVQPAMIGVAALVALANVNHRVLLENPRPAKQHGEASGHRRKLMPCLHNTRYNDYCQEAHLSAPPIVRPKACYSFRFMDLLGGGTVF